MEMLRKLYYLTVKLLQKEVGCYYYFQLMAVSKVGGFMFSVTKRLLHTM